MSSVQRGPMQCYLHGVRDEQRIIATWMRRQLARTGWTAKAWAERARVNPSTVTRAMEEDYTSVTSVPTLDALAKAAGATSPLEALGEAFEPRTGVPSEAALRVILAGILRDRAPDDLLPRMAYQMRQGLSVLARNPELASNPDSLLGVAETLSELSPRLNS